jgi:hypothetical protein
MPRSAKRELNPNLAAYSFTVSLIPIPSYGQNRFRITPLKRAMLEGMGFGRFGGLELPAWFVHLRLLAWFFSAHALPRSQLA